jgi:hypothetical protein
MRPSLHSTPIYFPTLHFADSTLSLNFALISVQLKTYIVNNNTTFTNCNHWSVEGEQQRETETV